MQRSRRAWLTSNLNAEATNNDCVRSTGSRVKRHEGLHRLPSCDPAGYFLQHHPQMVVYHSKSLVEQTVKILHLTAFGFRDRGGGALTRRPL
jgi:hypothetical protein